MTVDRRLPTSLVLIALLVASVGSLGAPLVTSVAGEYDVSLATAQWTLTVTLLTGAVATPLLGRLGSGPRRRTTTLATLGVVAAGSVCTVVPGSFPLLIAGRAAQGVGLGLAPLLMATAREELDEGRATRVIAMLSVATTAAIGLGYPAAGLLTDAGGVEAAYTAGLALTAAALVVGVRTLPPPRSADQHAPPVDWVGAALLGAALAAVLVALGDDALWSGHPRAATAALVGGLLLLAAWLGVERRVRAPLVDLRALRHPVVLRADLAMFVGGTAMYLLLTLATRYLQTPPSVGYGFGLNTFEAGLVLVPFSVAGFVAGRLVPRVVRRIGPSATVAWSVVLVAVGFLVFAVGRPVVAGPVVAVTLLGLGVGAVSASMPAMILAVTPHRETAGAMSVNQVVRSVGFSLGSAVGGLVLSMQVLDDGFPEPVGYVWASAVGGALAVAAAAIVVLGRPRPVEDLSG